MALVSFDPLALERCFLTADLLAEHYGDEKSEYALLGLATANDPLHVIATPLLPGQQVTRSTVEQSGHDVLRMRREIQSLSGKMGVRLVPICFVHRHPNQCTASQVDHEFLTGVFIDQVSTATSWEETVSIDHDLPWCGCADVRDLWSGRSAPRSLRVEYSLAFSLIVNREREHEIYAARVDTCPICGRRIVREVPATLAPSQRDALSPRQIRLLADRLRVEIAEKLVFKPTLAPPEVWL